MCFFCCFHPPAAQRHCTAHRHKTTHGRLDASVRGPFRYYRSSIHGTRRPNVPSVLSQDPRYHRCSRPRPIACQTSRRTAPGPRPFAVCHSRSTCTVQDNLMPYCQGHPFPATVPGACTSPPMLSALGFVQPTRTLCLQAALLQADCCQTVCQMSTRICVSRYPYTWEFKPYGAKPNSWMLATSIRGHATPSCPEHGDWASYNHLRRW
jgi:hypothetical protein